jgi:biotin transport system permease protein
MLTLTSPLQTWAHPLPAGAKMAALAVWTALLFNLDTPTPLALAALTTAALPLSCGLTFALTSARLLRPLWPFVLIITLWHLWTQDPTGGATVLLRLTTAVAAANFVTMTTRLSDMMAVLTTLARPLSALGLNPRTLALAVALVIRFVPVMLTRTEQIAAAFRARSARRPGWRVLVPALLAALDDAAQVAEALRARGGTG